MSKSWIHHIFSIAVSAYAIFHTVGAIGMFLGGSGLDFTSPGRALDTLYIYGTALFFAVSLDVGQVSTSFKIRRFHRNGIRPYGSYITFAVLGLAMAYLQWFYLVHTMPELQIGSGVRSNWINDATWLRDAVLYIFPTLLPVTLLLYTFSGDEESAAPVPSQTNQTATPPAILNSIASELPQIADLDAHLLESPQIADLGIDLLDSVKFPGVTVKEGAVLAQCGFCDWQDEYDTERQATNALNAHLRHCAKKHEPFSANGHK